MILEMLKILAGLILITWILECVLFALFFLTRCIWIWRDRHGVE